MTEGTFANLRKAGEATVIAFDWDLNENGQSIFIDYATRGSDTIIYNDDFPGVIRTVVKLFTDPREPPEIITSYPVLGAQ